MSNFVKILAVLGMIVLAAIIVDFGHVLIASFLSSSITLQGVETVNGNHPVWFPWKEIFTYAGIAFAALSWLLFWAGCVVAKKEKKLEELEAKLKKLEASKSNN